MISLQELRRLAARGVGADPVVLKNVREALDEQRVKFRRGQATAGELVARLQGSSDVQPRGVAESVADLSTLNPDELVLALDLLSPAGIASIFVTAADHRIVGCVRISLPQLPSSDGVADS